MNDAPVLVSSGGGVSFEGFAKIPGFLSGDGF
jgi:hypothetical protein